MSHSASVPHTVGLVAPNGRLGLVVLARLVKAQEAGEIQLVVLHRPGSPPKIDLPHTVSVRQIDLEGDMSAVESALRGINTLVSALGSEHAMLGVTLVEAFAKSPEAFTVIPAEYGNPSHPDELANNQGLVQVLSIIHAGSERAQELGLGVTRVSAGLFDEYAFRVGTTGINLKENIVQASSGQLKNKFPIVSMPYLGAGIAELATRPPQDIKGKTFSLVEYWPTGQQVVDVLTELNGAPATVLDYSPEDRETELTTAPVGPVIAGLKGCWTRNKWAYEGEFKPKDHTNKSLLETVSQWM